MRRDRSFSPSIPANRRLAPCLAAWLLMAVALPILGAQGPDRPPMVTGLTLGTVPAQWVLSISGRDLGGTTRVTINGRDVPQFVVLSDVIIQVVLPPDTVTGSLVVVGPAGTASRSFAFEVAEDTAQKRADSASLLAACGGVSQTCCSDNGCQSGLTCVLNKCLYVSVLPFDPGVPTVPARFCGFAGGRCCKDDICQEGLACNLKNNVCRACGKGGDICCAGGACAAGFACTDGRCLACGNDGGFCCPELTGQPCGSGLECANGLCLPIDLGDFSGDPCDPEGDCPRSGLGDSCLRDGDCQDGLECRAGSSNNRPVCTAR